MMVVPSCLYDDNNEDDPIIKNAIGLFYLFLQVHVYQS